MMKQNKGIHSFYLLLFLILFSACDFTPRLHKNILVAQDFISNQDYNRAVLQYEKILKGTIPNGIKAKILYQLGELYSIHLQNNERAIGYYGEIRKYSEELVWIVKAEERMGEINFTFLRDFKKSRDSYKKLSDFFPKLDKFDFYQFRLALSRLNLNELDEAYKNFTDIKNNRSHKFNTKSWYYLGLIHFKKKQWDKAITIWKNSLTKEKRRDNIVQTIFLIANAYETKEELKKAYNLYYSILGEYPNIDVIKNRLDSIYNRRIARKR